jgi:hypothetical protein
LRLRNIATICSRAQEALIGGMDMAKKRQQQQVTVTTEKVGVDWKPVKASSLDGGLRRDYQEYVNAFKKASELARKLKDDVTQEWNEKYPSGIKGKIAAFNAIGGRLLVVMKDKEKKAGPEKVFDENEGEDVFAEPAQEPRSPGPAQKMPRQIK